MTWTRLSARTAFAEIHEQITGLLSGPRPGGVSRDAQDVHAAGLDLHHEQDVQALPVCQLRVGEIGDRFGAR
jgi:hypothetical protein